MTKVTITIEGDIADLAPVLAKISELKEVKSTSTTSTVVGGEAEWTEERVLEIWEDLSENCKNVLIEVAKTEDMTWKQLQEKLNWAPNKIGGSLSSLGARLRNHSLKGISNPLVENEADGYNLLPVWRKTILKQTEKR
jgi:hypothetical protein